MTRGWRTALWGGLIALMSVVVGLLLAVPPGGLPPPADRRPSLPEAWSGRCRRVHDGDTVTVDHGGQALAVRLDGIDCPELKQAYGGEARSAARDLVLGKVVTVRPKELDRYGRVVARVGLPDGRDLSLVMVQTGLAWWYREHAIRDRALQAAEEQARAARLGLWAEREPQPPWDYRRAMREQESLRASGKQAP